MCGILGHKEAHLLLNVIIKFFTPFFSLSMPAPFTSENDLPDFDGLFHLSNSNPVENCRWVFQNKVKNHNTKVNSRPVKGKFSMKIWKTHLPM